MPIVIYKIKWDMLLELFIRVTLWCLFLWFNFKEPYIDEISEHEIWKYKYQPIPSYIPAFILWITIFLVPLVVALTEYHLTKEWDDPKYLCLGITLSYALTGAITTYLKILIGRPRPDFYFRCFPDGQGNDYKKCTGRRHIYLDGRKSFPSGHASFAFSCMLFVSLYFARKFHLFEEKRGQSWQLVVCILPLVVAATTGVSRICDHHHHYEDVAAGSALGSVISYFCYKLYFPKVDTKTASM